MTRTALYWLTHDLRIDDNAALRAAADADRLLCVYCLDPDWFRPTRFQAKPLGEHRWRFLCETLTELNRALQHYGQRLHVLFQEPVTALGNLIEQYRVDTLICSHAVGLDERQQLEQLKAEQPTLSVIECWTHTLFTPEHLPFGREHLQHYFSTARPACYKDTRNALDGDGGSGFSPWLANGALSPRQLVAALRDYEQQRVANESTYWLFFELLWREYFQWYALKYGVGLFRFRGIKTHPPLTSFYAGRYRQWIEGTTPWPIVNACMKQLAATGLMSNRGRQLVASCLVNELGIDWRYGAAWFQQQLIDHDVASNWGNWQYLAGVGADPRGQRHFDLDKQTRLYDPHGHFIRHWQGDTGITVLDSVDCAD